MTDTRQEISEDYDLDEDANVFNVAFGEDIDRLNSDVKEGNRLESEIHQLLGAAVAVESEGSAATSFIEAHKAHLLSGTAFADVGIETLVSKDADSVETEMAMEALSASIKAKMEHWAERIVDLAKSLAEKVTNILGHLWSDIKERVQTLGTVVWDKTKAAGTIIKAHPYKTVFAALTAAAAVAAIVGYAATGTYSNESALQSFLYRIQDMVNKIHWPFGKPTVEIVQNGTRILYTMEDTTLLTKISETPVQLGWTQSAVKAVGGQAGRIFTSLKTAAHAVYGKVGTAMKFINEVDDPGTMAKTVTAAKKGSKFAGWISQQLVNKAMTTALWAIVGVLTKLLTDIVLKAFRTVKESLTSLNPVVQEA